MAKFDFKYNSEQKNHFAPFMGKLITVGDKEFENPNGTKYFLGTVEYENAKGETVQNSTMIYANNLKYGMKEGETYRCTVIITDGIDPKTGKPYLPLLTMSHLTGATRATLNDFGFYVEAVEKVEDFVEVEA